MARVARIDGVAAPIVGTQDDDAGYGATFDALNIWELTVKWKANPIASLDAGDQLPVATFRLGLPVRADIARLPAAAGHCGPRPVSRHPVLPAASDLSPRLPELRQVRGARDEPVGRGRSGPRRCPLVRDPAHRAQTPSRMSSQQQGTYAPGDGVHRWMGSAAMDWQGNIALGYSVVNGIDVYPGHPLHRPPCGRAAGHR